MDQSKEDRKWLHEKMQSKGYNVGSYEEFEKSLQNKDDADWYYRKANEIGLNIGSRDDYDSIFVGKPQDPLLQTPWQQKPAAEITPTDSVTTETEPVNITEPVNVAEPKNEKPVDPEKLKQYIIDHKGEVFNPKTVDMYGAHDKNKTEWDMFQEGRLQQLQAQRAFSTIGEQLNERIKANDEALKEAYSKRNEKTQGPKFIFGAGANVAPKVNTTEDDESIKNLLAEQDYLGSAKKVFDAAKDNAGFFRGMKDAVSSSFLTFGVSDLHNAERINAVNQKVEAGQPLTESEQSLLTSLGLQQIVNQEYNDMLSSWYKAGKTTAEMAPFMAEMAINPTSGLGRMAVKASVKKFGEKGAKAIAAKILSRTIGDVAGATAMTATTGMPSVAADAMNRQLGYVDTDIVGGGEFAGKGFKEGEEASEAWRKAFTSRAIENWSEMVGEYFSPVGKAVGKGFAKTMDAMKLGKVNEFIDNINSSEWAKVLDDFTEQTQWNGPVGEFAEEQVGMVFDALLVGDTKWSDITDLDKQLDVALGVGVFGTFMSLLRIGGYRTPKYRARKAVEKADKDAASVFGEDWELVKDFIDTASDSELPNVLANPSYTKEQAKAAFMYANAVKAQQAVNTTKEKQKIDEPGNAEVEAEAAYDEGTEITQPREKHAAKRALDRAEAAIGVGSENADEQQFAQMVMAGADSPVETINALAEQGYSDEQILKAKDYYNAANRMNGMTDALLDEVDAKVEQANSEVDANTNADTGAVVKVLLKDGLFGYVVKGAVVNNEDSSIDVNNSDDTIMVRTELGEVKMMNPNKDLVGVAWMEAPAALKEANNNLLRDSLIKQGIAEIDWHPNTPNPKVGDRFEVDGVPVVIVGENGKGSLFVAPVGLYAYAQGNEAKMQALLQKAQQSDPVSINTYKEWASANLDAQEEAAQAQEQEAQPAESNAPVMPGSQEEVQPGAEAGVTEESAAPVEEAAQEPAPLTLEDVVASLPKNKKGEIDYEAMSPQQQYQYTSLSESAEVALEDLQADIEQGEIEIEKVQKQLASAKGGKRVELRDKIRQLTVANEELKAFYNSVKPAEQEEAGVEDAIIEEAEGSADLTEGQPDTEKPAVKPKKRPKRPQAVSEEEQPMNALEYAAQLLADGAIKLVRQSVADETGYGNEELGKFIKLYAKPENGGVSVERAGELMMQYDREEGTNFFDQTDANAGRDTILELLGMARTWGDISNFIKNNRAEQAKREEEAERAAYESWVEENFHMSAEDYEAYEEIIARDLSERDLTEEQYQEFMSTFVDETFNNVENEQQGITGEGEGRSEILPGTQPLQTGGNTGAAEGSEEANGGVDGENGPVLEGASGSEIEQTEKPYTIEPAQYTTKRGKVLDMFLVKFPGEVRKDVLSSAKVAAKEMKGWWSREDGGFLMRNEADAEKIGAFVADQLEEEPITLEDVKDLAEGNVSFSEPQEPAEKNGPVWQYVVNVDKKTGRTEITRDDISGPIPIGDGSFNLSANSPQEMLDILSNPLNNMQSVLESVEITLENRVKTLEMNRRQEEMRAQGVNGFKIGEKVLYKGKEATIHEFQLDGRPVLDDGMGPVIYTVADWSDVKKIGNEPKQYHGGDKVFSIKHNADKDIFVAHHVGGKTEYTFTDGTKASEDEVQDPIIKEEKPVIRPKEGEFYKNNMAGGNAVAKISGVGETVYVVSFASDLEDARGGLFMGEKIFSFSEMEQLLRDGSFTKIENPSGNKLVSDERYAELRERMKMKLRGQMNMGIDPEILAIGTEMAVYHIEKGARKFAEYAKAMIEDLGDAIRPYLKAFYNGARDLPEMESNGLTAEMTPYEEVAKVNTATIGKAFVDPIEAAETIVKEEAAEKQAVIAKERVKKPKKPSKKAKENVSLLGDLFNLNTEENEAGRNETGNRSSEGNSGTHTEVGSEEREEGIGTSVRSEAGSVPGNNVSDKDGSGRIHGVSRGTSPVKRNENNFSFGEGHIELPSGEIAKLKANIEAIKTLKEIEASCKPATDKQKAILSKYVGWGGLSAALDEQKFLNSKGWLADRNWNEKYLPYYIELRDLLTKEEFDDAVQSTITSHYTPEEVIRGMWKAVERMGFKGGRISEPAAGVGHILGFMPKAISERSIISGTELDSLSGRIAKTLYPDANLKVQGYEKEFAPKSKDLVITNVPFGKTTPYDKALDKALRKKMGSAYNLHNYFIAKGLLELKDGGIGVFVTSSATMDGANSKFREWVAANGIDLVGAIRLPNDAFLKNAGTSVTADMLVFRKRKTGERSNGVNFVSTTQIGEGTYKENNETRTKPIMVNEYFAEHPEMMFGEMKTAHDAGSGGLYSGASQTCVAPKGANLAEELQNAIMRLDAITTNAEESQDTIAQDGMTKATDLKNGTLVAEGNNVMVAINGELQPIELSEKKKEFTFNGKKQKVADAVRDYNALKETLKSLIKAEQSEKENPEPLRKKLNKEYDAFVAKYGTLNRNKALSDVLAEDFEHNLPMSLENVKRVPSATGKSMVWEVTKGEGILAKRVSFPVEEPTKAESLDDAIHISKSYRGVIDVPYIASLIGKTEEEVTADMLQEGLAYRNPITGNIEDKDTYLSGNVKEKLEQARAMEEEHPGEYQRNVEDLAEVQPETVRFGDISYRIGTPWIPTEYVNDFASEVLGVRNVDVQYIPSLNEFVLGKYARIDDFAKAGQFRTDRVGVVDLLGFALNQRKPKIFDRRVSYGPMGKVEERIPNEAETQAAAEKIMEITDKFIEYIDGRTDIHRELERIYNDKYNNYRLKTYELPSFEHYPNANANITLRNHQKKAVQRCLSESTLLAHQVGTGKTFTMITTAMEMRRLGIANKPMIVVQNATLEDFVKDFYKLYPGANILAPGKDERSAENRKRLFNLIATGDFDAIVIPQSFMQFIPDDEGRKKELIQKRIDEYLNVASSIDDRTVQSRIEKEIENLRDTLEGNEKRGGKKRSVKDIAKAESVIKSNVGQLLDRKTDDVLTFEQMGIDALFIDEAHNFKKIGFASKMSNVKGVDTSASQRANSLLLKAQYVQEKNGGRNVILATGTPITNTMAEVWTMMKFVSPEILETYNIQSFDDFATTFGVVEPSLEFTATGNFKIADRFKSYVNVPELVKAFRSHADVVLTTDVKEFKESNNIPKLKDGQMTNVVIEKNEDLEDVMDVLIKKLEAYNNMTGSEKREWSALPLVVFSRAKQAAIDLRLLNPSYEDNPNSKTNHVVRNVLKLYKESTPDKGTQMIFCDSYQSPGEAPKMDLFDYDADVPRFNLYEDIKQKLVEGGVPASEIAIVNNYDGERRKQLFEKVRNGDVRILLGSTEKMGVGVNVQDRMYALHHIDAPIRPMDFEQRNGRILRQGNLYATWGRPVNVVTYGVQGTLDATAYDRLRVKQDFINQMMKGDVSGRIMEEQDEEDPSGMTFNQMAATLSGDKTAQLLFVAENELKKLRNLKRSDFNSKSGMGMTIQSEERRLVGLNDKLELWGKAKETVSKYFPEGVTEVKVNGETFTEKFGPALDPVIENYEEAYSLNRGTAPLKLTLNNGNGEIVVHFNEGKMVYELYAGNEHLVESRQFNGGKGLMSSVEHQLKSTEKNYNETKQKIAETKNKIQGLEKAMNAPWGREEDLKKKEQEVAELKKQLEEKAAANTKKAAAPVQQETKQEEDDELYRTSEEEEIIATAKANGTYMKAPNGKPSKLNEDQWVQVRTKAFKKWFGDWEFAAKLVNVVKVVDAISFKNFKEAREWAKNNILGVFNNHEIGEINISGEAINKYLSEKAVNQSDSPELHLAALQVLPKLIKESIVGEVHGDRDNNTNIMDIVRLYGCMVVDGKTCRVKTTVKRYNDPNVKTKAYSYEVTEIELLDGTLEAHTQGADSSTTSNNSITVANLLKNAVNSKGNPIINSSKIVDENGEPLIVYHGTDAEFEEFDKTHNDKAYNGFFFTEGKEMAASYGKNVMEVFLNVREAYEIEGNGRNWNDLNTDIINYVPKLEDQIRLHEASMKKAVEKGVMSQSNYDFFKDRYYKKVEFIKDKSKNSILDIIKKYLYRWQIRNFKSSHIVTTTREIEYYLEQLDQNTNIIFKDIKDYGKDVKGPRTAHNVFVTTSPNQIKSATGNKGTFDEGNANIYKRSGEGALTADEVSMANDPVGKVLGTSTRTAAERKTFAERERQRMIDRVNSLAKKLGLKNVEIVTDPSTLTGNQRKAKGFYSKSKRKITIVIPNHRSVFDAEQTLLHEAVAHFGLRELFGAQFDVFLNNVYRNAAPEVRERINKLAMENGWDFTKATEEYLASLAEDTNFETINESWWNKIKQLFLNMLHQIGFEGFTGVTLTDNELRYILWRSYENLVEPGSRRSIFGEAADIVKQDQLKVGNYSHEETAKPGLVAESSPYKRTAEDVIAEFEEMVPNHPNIFSVRSEEDIDSLPTDRITKSVLKEKMKDKRKDAIQIKEDNLMVLFVNNIDEAELRDVIPHELAHFASRNLKIDDSYKMSAYAYLQKHFPGSFEKLQQYPREKWGEEAVAYLFEEMSKKMGFERILNGKFDTRNDIGYIFYNITNYLNHGRRNNPLRYGKGSSEGIHSRGTGTTETKEMLGVGNGRPRGEAQGSVPGNERTGASGELGSVPGSSMGSAASRRTEEGVEDDVLYRPSRVIEGMADNTARNLYEDAVKGYKYRLQEGYQDSMLALKKLQEAIVKQKGGKLEEWEDAYTAENQMSSRDTAEIENFTFDFFKPMMKEVASFLKQSGLDYEGLRTYLFAKSGLERNRDFTVRDAINERASNGEDVSGIYEAYMQRKKELLQDLKDGIITFRQYCDEMDNEAIMIAPDTMGRDYSGLSSLFDADNFTEEAIAEVERVEGLADVTSMWRSIREATQFSLDRAKQSGVMNTDVHQKLSEMFEWYIPMRGWSATKARDVYEYFGQQEGVFNPTVKAAVGRKSLADDPLAVIANMAESAIFQGNRNQVKQKLLNLAFGKPTNLITVLNSWIENKGTKKDPRWEYVYPDIEQDDDADTVAMKIRQFEEEMEKKKDAGVAKNVRGKADVPYITTPKEISEHIIRVKRNGREFVMIINGNPRAAQAINGLTNPETYTGIIERVSRRLNQFMAAAFTTKNPTFIMRNLSRDLIFSNTAVFIKENNAYGKKFRSNQGKVLVSMRGLMKRYQSGKLDMSNELDKMFAEFIKNGGETGFAQLTSVDEYKKKIQRALAIAKNDKLAKGKKVAGALMDTIEFYNRCAEDVSRFTVYMTSRQMGRSIQRSVSDAKEITVNFNKRGSGSKAGGLIGFGAQSMRSLYLFFNAAVQALVNFKRLAKQHPVAFTTSLSVYAATGFVMPIINEFLSSILGGDDDDYENLPEWVRRNNLVISLGKWKGDAMFLTIPLPVEMRAFYGLGETTNQLMAGNVRGTDAAWQIAGQFAEMMPLNFVTDGAGPWNAFTPDAFKPIVQAYIANKDWTGKPIYRDNGFNKEMPEWTKAYAGTSKWLVNSAELLNEFAGGDKYKSAWLDVNPARLEHLFTGYLGGFGDMIMGTGKTLAMLWDEDYRNVRNTPVIKAFLNQSDERTSYAQVKKDYASFKKEYDDTVRRLNGYEKEMNLQESAIEYAERMDFLQRSSQMKRYEVMRLFERELNKLYEEMKKNPDKDVQKSITVSINQLKANAVEALRSIK